MKRDARLSKCGRYRWSLTRCWAGGDGRTVCFVMLNPSTANAHVDDPTIRRCIRFARDWGYSKLVVRNLFAIRATKPRDLLVLENPTGGRSGNQSLARANGADVIVAAWGAFVPFDRVATARRVLDPAKLVCLGTCLLYTSPSPRDQRGSRMPSSA